MPKLKQPGGLKSLCLTCIFNKADTFWIPQDKEHRSLIDNPNLPIYFNTPFEDLNDENVDCLLRMFYKNCKLNNLHFFYFLHAHLRSIDLSFLRKSSLVNANVCKMLGKNCFKLTRLNLCYQKHLTPKNICDILHSMHCLKYLNLGHTQANCQVAEQISVSCKKLTNLNLENCVKIYDDSLQTITDAVESTLEVLDVDNISLTDATIKKILFKCKNLRVLNAPNLVQVLNELYQIYDFYQNCKEVTYEDCCEVSKIEAIEINSNVVLKPEMIEAIALICPKLKSLTAFCYADKYVLGELYLFNNLSQLVLGNNNNLITFKFEGYFMQWLKKSFGKNLKSLELISVPDVNLKSIGFYCSRLSKLKVEINYDYDPAPDNFLDENNNEIVFEPNKNLTELSINRIYNRYEQVPEKNVASLKNHIHLLLMGASVKKLYLNGLQELDDDFFISIFSVHDSFEYKMVWQYIQVLELKHICGITAEFVKYYLLRSSNNVLDLINLEGCKAITKKDYLNLVRFVEKYNIDCQVKWI